jgi:hypothetical protein
MGDVMDTVELKQALVGTLLALKEESKHKRFNAVGDAFINGQIQVLEKILTTIAKGDNDMAKLQNELVSQVVRLDDIAMRQRSSELEANIKELAASLKPGEAALMNAAKIKYGHLSTKISIMKKRKDLDANIHVVKRGDVTYLAKK